MNDGERGKPSVYKGELAEAIKAAAGGISSGLWEDITPQNVADAARKQHLSRNEFFRRLRIELIKQQKGIPELRASQAKTVEIICTGITAANGHKIVRIATAYGTIFDVLHSSWHLSNFDSNARQLVTKRGRQLTPEQREQADDAAEWMRGFRSGSVYPYMSATLNERRDPRRDIDERLLEAFYQREETGETMDAAAEWTTPDNKRTYSVRQIEHYYKTLTEVTRAHWRLECPCCQNTVAFTDDGRIGWALGQWVHATKPNNGDAWLAPMGLLAQRMNKVTPPKELQPLWDAFDKGTQGNGKQPI